MSDIIRNYFQNVSALIEGIKITDSRGGGMDRYEGLRAAADMAAAQAAAGRKILFIGNGGSAAIASHMATDYCKNGGIRAMAFNDSSLLTCISNDYGYQHVFEKPIEMFAEAGDLLFAISSSGKSENILRGVQAARGKGCKVITLSGFGVENPLRGLGDLNLWVPADRYGPVEVIHHLLCHCILDAVIRLRGEKPRCD